MGYVVTMAVPMCTSQDFVNWVCGPGLDHRYLAYVLQLEQATIRRFASGTTHQTVYFPEAKAFHIAAPDIEEQRAIAATLGALDDKIDSNRRVIATGVDLARTGCSSGDQRTTIGAVAEISKGLSYKGSGLRDEGGEGILPLVNLANFVTSGWLNPNGLKFYGGDYKQRHIAGPADVLVANTDLTQRRVILGRPALVPPGLGPTLFTHHVFAVRPHDPTLSVAIWAQLNSQRFRERADGFATGTTVAALPPAALLDFEIALPAALSINAARQVLEVVWQREEETVRLAALRDALLPELLCGRIRVPEAREAVAATTS